MSFVYTGIDCIQHTRFIAKTPNNNNNNNKLMPYSLHSHSGQYCMHAYGDLEEIVKNAINKGFIMYGLSEHMPRSRLEDLYPEEVEVKD